MARAGRANTLGLCCAVHEPADILLICTGNSAGHGACQVARIMGESPVIVGGILVVTLSPAELVCHKVWIASVIRHVGGGRGVCGGGIVA